MFNSAACCISGYCLLTDRGSSESSVTCRFRMYRQHICTDRNEAVSLFHHLFVFVSSSCAGGATSTCGPSTNPSALGFHVLPHAPVGDQSSVFLSLRQLARNRAAGDCLWREWCRFPCTPLPRLQHLAKALSLFCSVLKNPTPVCSSLQQDWTALDC